MDEVKVPEHADHVVLAWNRTLIRASPPPQTRPDHPRPGPPTPAPDRLPPPDPERPWAVGDLEPPRTRKLLTTHPRPLSVNRGDSFGAEPASRTTVLENPIWDNLPGLWHCSFQGSFEEWGAECQEVEEKKYLEAGREGCRGS